MSKVGKVVRTQDSEDGVEVVVEGDADNLVTADHFCTPGVDARPVPGDYVHLIPMQSDRYHAVVYDMVEVSVAKDGEVIVMSRSPSTGKKVASIHLTADGNVNVLTASGEINLNGLIIDRDGNLHTPGEVTTAKGGIDINLSDHIHLHSMGPTKGPSSPPSV